MNDNRRIAKNSGILYVRLIITSIIALFSSRIILQSLGVSDFGLYSVVGGIVVMINVLNAAIAAASYRYIAFEIGKGNIASVNKVFNICLTLHICIALIVVLLAETLGRYYIYNFLNVSPGKVGDAIFVFRFSVLAVVFSIVSIPFLGLITAQEKFSIRASIEVISAILKLVVAILLFNYLGNRLRLYSSLIALVIAITAIMYISYCYKKHGDIVRWKFQNDRTLYKEILSFSGWSMLEPCAHMSKVQGAALLINVFFGTVINASFGIANQVNGLVLTFTHNLNHAAVPQIYKSYGSGDTDRTMQIVSCISKYTIFLMLLPTLPILLETQFLLNLWLGKVPQYTSIFCRLIILNGLVNCLMGSVTSVIQATGNIKYFQIIINTTSLLSLPVAFFFFKLGYPPYSIMVAYIVTGFINVIVSQILLKNLIHFDIKKFIRFFHLRVFYVILLVFPLFVIINMYPVGIIRFVTFFIVAEIWLLAAIYVVGLEKVEREILLHQIGKLYARFLRK